MSCQLFGFALKSVQLMNGPEGTLEDVSVYRGDFYACKKELFVGSNAELEWAQIWVDLLISSV